MSLTLAASAARLGTFCWTERRLFETLGASVAGLSDAGAKVLLDRHASHAAWRAGQWWDRLPVLASVERDDLVTPDPAGLDALYQALTPPEEPGDTVQREVPVQTEAPVQSDAAVLAGFYRVALPRLAAAYRAYGAATGPVADGPARRTLRQVLADVEGDRAEGEDLLNSLLDTETTVDEVAAAVARAERLLVGASSMTSGGPVG